MYRMLRIPLLALLLSAGAAGAMPVLSGSAGADPSPTLLRPPGCTGGWNTVQAAEHNQAPGTSPGCLVAMLHAHN